MVIKRITIGLLILLWAAVGVAHAQTARDWIAWLYDPTNGTITQVNKAGSSVGTFYLPLSQAFNAYGETIAVSPNGRFIAYTTYDSTTPGGAQNQQLFVYDRTIDTTRFVYDLGGASGSGLSIQPEAAAFNEERQNFAFGYVRDGVWQVVMADLVTQSVQAMLDAGTSAGVVQESGVPVVRYNGGDWVAFVMVNNGAAGGAYRWSLAGGEVYREAVYTSLAGDTLVATGEAVMPAWNGSTGRVDTIDVFSASLGRFRLHAHPRDIRQTVFAADGMQVVGVTSDEASGQDALVVLNRDGTVAATILGALNALHGTPTGFIGTFAVNGAVGLARVDTLANDPYLETIWSGAGSTQLVHVQGVGSAPTQLPAWTPLQ
ncbi:MAG TPA: hypothetical protein PKX07_11165 [Aggregatilineales bacterium]|nr:hypothetical protein [Aggregatilineales bacterium]